MNPDAGRWMLECIGEPCNERKMTTLALERMVRMTVPQYLPMLRGHHDAAVDAQLARLVYVSLLCRARPYMRGGQTAHEQKERGESVKSNGLA